MPLAEVLRRGVGVPGLTLVLKVIAPALAGKPLKGLGNYAWALSPVGASAVDVFKELQYSVAFHDVVSNS